MIGTFLTWNTKLMMNKYEEEVNDEQTVDALDCVKLFENELGTKTKLMWKNNFYRKFLTLVSIMERGDYPPLCNSDSVSDTTPLHEQIGKLLKPLNQNQIDKLNIILKKLQFSKLLTNSIKTRSGKVVIFHDSGLPYILSSFYANVCLGSIVVLNVERQFKSQLSIFLPPCSAEEETTFRDVLCGLLSPILNIIKERKSNIRRPLNAYMLFSQQKVNEIKLKNPTLKIIELARIIVNCWENLNENEQQLFVEEENKLKMEYQRQLENFQYIISGLN